MAATTPIEIWEKILKYAIAVPLLFDAKPIDGQGGVYQGQNPREAPYWESERTRNRLRRVCRSWNTFLQSYDHRYVRLSDIYRGILLTTVARMAIRLNIDPDLEGEDDIQGLFSGMSRCLRVLITPPGPYITTATVDGWKMEILEGTTVMDTRLYDSFVEKAPRLRVVLGKHFHR